MSSAVESALIAALVALVVAVVSPVIQRRHTDRRWLFDRRHEAYVTFLRESHEMQRRVTERRAEPGEKRQKQIQSLRDELMAVNHSYWAVRLLGSTETQRPASLMFNRLASIATTDSGPDRDRWMAEINHAEADFVTLVRVEIQPRAWWRRLPARQ